MGWDGMGSAFANAEGEGRDLAHCVRASGIASDFRHADWRMECGGNSPGAKVGRPVEGGSGTEAVLWSRVVCSALRGLTCAIY